MDVFEAIENRYSYRGAFTAGAVPQADVENILRAGLAAPSGHNYQTPRLVALTSAAQRAKMAEILPLEPVKTAPLVVVVLSGKKPMKDGRDFEFCDYAAATENILLAVTALGYASVWIDGQLYDEDRARRVAELVRAPAGFTPRVVLPIGVAAAGDEYKFPPKRKSKLPFEERAFFNHF